MSANCRVEFRDCTFSDEEIETAATSGGLLTMEMEITTCCNFRCAYCYVPGDVSSHFMPFGLFQDSVLQAKRIGCRRVILLGGEPMLHPQIREMVSFLHGEGIVPEIFTNGTRIDRETVELFNRCDVFLVIKCNALDPATQNRLSGIPAADEMIRNAFSVLVSYRREKINAGEPLPAFGLNTVICRANYLDIPDIWRLARNHGFLPCIERMNPVNHAAENAAWLNISIDETRAMFERLAKIDREEFGKEWPIQPPLVGRRCLRNRYSCVVAWDGNVKPCVGIPIVVGNVGETPLAEIIATSPVLRDLRNYRETIHGPCRQCPQHDSCYGCRGTAFQLTGDYLASDPLCWRIPHPSGSTALPGTRRGDT